MVDLRGNVARPTGPFDNLPDPADAFRSPVQLDYLRRLDRALKAAFTRVVSRDHGTPDFMLISPGGKVYRVTVDESGALTTEYIRG